MDWRPSPALRSGQDVAPGGTGAGHQRYNVRHPLGQQRHHAEAGGHSEDFVRWQDRSGLRESSAVQRRFALVARRTP
jgi:hypothetical protein